MPIIRTRITNNILKANSIGFIKLEDFELDTLNAIDKHLYIEFLTAVDTWTVTHNLAKFPSIRCTDTLGRPIIGYITDDNINTVTINFKSPKSGYLILN